MTTTHLKPCPFCGAEAIGPYDLDSRMVLIRCSSGAKCPATMWIDRLTEEAAVAAWNTRAPTTPANPPITRWRGTPGPWRVELDYGSVLVVDGKSHSVADCEFYGPDRSGSIPQTNARAIALVPDMFAYIAQQAANGYPEALALLDKFEGSDK